ncbi:MAG: hypothetical protein IPM50_02545 [Acidobacteriota bacterium]|nr:MAG: hypothetical protein IPM50_02545 [Acidobacteriota bacterium]
MKRISRITASLLIAAFSVIVGTAQIGDAARDKSVTGKKTGILLLAHGGKDDWNNEVINVAAAANRTMPVEVAFGMASKRSIQQAVDKLVSRGAQKIVAVPLFISSHSTVITSTEFLLGLRPVAPADLAIFAKMDHGGGGGHDSHQSMDTSFDPLTPVKSSVPIEMVSALGSHPYVADILMERAREISSEPKKEVVILVAHGPVSDEENARWLADMSVIAENMRRKSDFKRIEYLTVRDDAPEPVRSRVAEELRSMVSRATDEKRTVLIVPLLLSYGGIEEGIKRRLDGLTYTMSKRALLPDERLADWVILSAKRTVVSRN